MIHFILYFSHPIICKTVWNTNPVESNLLSLSKPDTQYLSNHSEPPTSLLHPLPSFSTLNYIHYQFFSRWTTLLSFIPLRGSEYQATNNLRKLQSALFYCSVWNGVNLTYWYLCIIDQIILHSSLIVGIIDQQMVYVGYMPTISRRQIICIEQWR